METWNSLCATHGDVNCRQNGQETLEPRGIIRGFGSQHKRQSRTNRDKSGYFGGEGVVGTLPRQDSAETVDESQKSRRDAGATKTGRVPRDAPWMR